MSPKDTEGCVTWCMQMDLRALLTYRRFLSDRYRATGQHPFREYLHIVDEEIARRNTMKGQNMQPSAQAPKLLTQPFSSEALADALSESLAQSEAIARQLNEAKAREERAAHLAYLYDLAHATAGLISHIQNPSNTTDARIARFQPELTELAKELGARIVRVNADSVIVQVL